MLKEDYVLRKLKNWIIRHKRLLAKTLIIGCLLVLTAIASYNIGLKQQAEKANRTSSANTLERLKKTAADKKTKKSTSSNTTPATATSSGFYRLHGTVDKISKTSLVIKLSSGNVVTLSITETTPYYQNGTKGAITNLKKDAKIMAVGSIGKDGDFKVTTIQAAK